MGLSAGLSAPFRGIAFVARHRLWGYLAIPLLLNLALAATGAWFGVRLARGWLDGNHWLTSAPTLRGIVLFVLAALISLLVFILLQPVVGAPFIDLLSERCETIVRGHAPSAGIVRGVWQAMLHGLLKLALYLFGLVVALVLGALTGVGGLIGTALYGVFLAYDGFDYPLARRGVSFGGKWRYLLSHPGQTLGYCFGAGLLYLVPLAALVAPAFAAVGATLAYLASVDTPSAEPAPSS